MGVTITGLFVHRFGEGDRGDIAGDALYAVLIYLLWVFALPRRPRSLVAALAIIFCSAVELLQLTDVPERAAAVFPPAVLILGAEFDQRDLLVYAFTIILVMLIDVAVSRRAIRRRTQTSR